MSSEYSGVGTSYPVTITIPDGSDADDAASAAIGIMQLADRTAALKAGHNFELYDTILHGDTQFADGSIASGSLDFISFDATNVNLGAGEAMFLNAGTDFRLQANNDARLDILRDLLVAVTRNLSITIGGNAVINPTGSLALGGTSVDLMGGVVHFSPAGIGLGSSTSTPTEVRGQLTAQHNATFVAGKTVAMNGVTSAADLTAAAFKGTVSDAAGITFTGQGKAHWRSRELVDADFSLGLYVLDPRIADAFYLESMASNRTAKFIETVATPGSVIEISMTGLTPVGRTLEIYNELETTLLVTMSPNTIPYTRWIKKPSGGWRRLA